MRATLTGTSGAPQPVSRQVSAGFMEMLREEQMAVEAGERWADVSARLQVDPRFQVSRIRLVSSDVVRQANTLNVVCRGGCAPAHWSALLGDSHTHDMVCSFCENRRAQGLAAGTGLYVCRHGILMQRAYGNFPEVTSLYRAILPPHRNLRCCMRCATLRERTLLMIYWHWGLVPKFREYNCFPYLLLRMSP